MPAFDESLMFKTTGNLTVSESSSVLTIRGTGRKGMAARVHIPQTAGTTTGIIPKYYGSDDGVTYRLVAQYPGDPYPADPIEMYTPIITNMKYIYEMLEIQGTWTPAFGAVQSGLVANVGYDWSRAVDWS